MFNFSPTSQLGAGGVRSAANNSFTPVLAHSSKGSKVWYIVWRGRGQRLSGRPSAFSSPRVPDQTFSLGGGLARGERRKMMLRKRTSISRMSAKEITMGKIPRVLKEQGRVYKYTYARGHDGEGTCLEKRTSYHQSTFVKPAKDRSQTELSGRSGVEPQKMLCLALNV